MLRDFVIIHTFLKFICSETSETQHLPSLLFLFFSLSDCFPLSEKKLKMVSEIDDIKTPCSAELLPSTDIISSIPLDLPSSSQRPPSTLSLPIPTDQDESISTEEIPIFKYCLNEKGLEFLSAVLGGDEDILNVEAGQHDANAIVCFSVLL